METSGRPRSQFLNLKSRNKHHLGKTITFCDLGFACTKTTKSILDLNGEKQLASEMLLFMKAKQKYFQNLIVTFHRTEELQYHELKYGHYNGFDKISTLTKYLL